MSSVFAHARKTHKRKLFFSSSAPLRKGKAAAFACVCVMPFSNSSSEADTLLSKNVISVTNWLLRRSKEEEDDKSGPDGASSSEEEDGASSSDDDDDDEDEEQEEEDDDKLK